MPLSRRAQDGNIWFTEEGLDRIGRITLAGVITEFAGLTAGAQPRGITRGPDGNLWFTENGGNRIGKINPTTGAVTEFSAGITAGAKPRSIAAGSDGNLWFTEEGIDKIGRVTPAGVVTKFGGPHARCVSLWHCVRQRRQSVVATIVLTGDGSLTVNRIGAGSGTVTSADAAINCGGTCGPVVYGNGSKITLTAAAGSGDVFTASSGACSGTASTCIATIIGATTVTATFVHASLDIDASAPATRYNASTDGVLVLRWMLGFTGPALTNGALDINNAQRINPIAIANYLGGLGLLLDIDDNGTVDALTFSV